MVATKYVCLTVSLVQAFRENLLNGYFMSSILKLSSVEKPVTMKICFLE